MADITYIFGAGASCQSMPLVSNFKDRFDVFEEHLQISSSSLNPNLIIDIKDFKKEISSHFSFDTYFKKLFHQEVDEKKINKSKVLLLLFFLFEHLADQETLNGNKIFQKQQRENRQKQATIDPRYEALVAGLIKPIRGKSEFYTNLNLFTWNYDANLILALNNFIAPRESFTEFIEKRIKNDYIEISSQIKLFHLNGFITHPILDKFYTQNPLNSLHNLLAKYSNEDFSSHIRNLKFSWEQEHIPTIEFESCISKSSTIILIGYSLPLYNRRIDSSILNHSNLRGKTLIIQNLDSKGIAEILESDFNINYDLKMRTKEDPQIKLADNCNSFIVPNSSFESFKYEIY